jgi:AAA domain (dynein-related subfamily)
MPTEISEVRANFVNPKELSIADQKHKRVTEHHRIRTPGELLSSLGIYAWDSIEDLILSSIAFPYTNIILVGEAGSGKTRGCQTLLEATYGKGQVRKVDTHIEDELSLGVCDVPDLRKGKMSTFFTDASIIEFRGVILDEFNRAREELRKIYLPFLSERTISGHVVKAITVIATMNPLGDVYNTEPLDLAAAERFSMVINIPEYHRVDETYRTKMLGSVRGSLAIDLQGELPESITAPWRAALFATQLAYDEIESVYITPLVKYVDSILMGAKSTNPPLRLQSTRTGKNLIRNILRLIAFHSAVYGEDPQKALEPLALKALNHVSTSELYDEAIPKEKLIPLHEKAKQFLIVRNPVLAYITQIFNPMLGLAALLSKPADALAEVDRSRLLEHHLDTIERSLKAELYLKDKALPWDVQKYTRHCVLLSDILISSLDIINSKVRMTDSVLVKTSVLASTIIIPSMPEVVPKELVDSAEKSLIFRSKIQREMLWNLLPIQITESNQNVYLSPSSYRLEGSETRDYPVDKESLTSNNFLILCQIIECYLTWIYKPSVDITDGIIRKVVANRLAFWKEKREYYDTIETT